MKPRGGVGQNGRLKCPLGFLVLFGTLLGCPSFPVVMFISYSAVIFYGVVYDAVQGGSNFYHLAFKLRNGKHAACNHRVMDAHGRLLSTKEA